MRRWLPREHCHGCWLMLTGTALSSCPRSLHRCRDWDVAVSHRSKATRAGCCGAGPDPITPATAAPGLDTVPMGCQNKARREQGEIGEGSKPCCPG